MPPDNRQVLDRAAAYWVMSAKRAETGDGRLTKLIEGCAGGYRLPEITGKARGADTQIDVGIHPLRRP